MQVAQRWSSWFKRESGRISLTRHKISDLALTDELPQCPPFSKAGLVAPGDKFRPDHPPKFIALGQESQESTSCAMLLLSQEVGHVRKRAAMILFPRRLDSTVGIPATFYCSKASQCLCGAK